MPPSAKQIKALTTKLTGQSTTVKKAVARKPRPGIDISPEEAERHGAAVKKLTPAEKQKDDFTASMHPGATRLMGMVSTDYVNIGQASVHFGNGSWHVTIHSRVNVSMIKERLNKFAMTAGVRIAWGGSDYGKVVIS